MKLTVTSSAQLKGILRRMRNHCRGRAVGLWRLGLPAATQITWELNGRQVSARFVRGQVRFWVDGKRMAAGKVWGTILKPDPKEAPPGSPGVKIGSSATDP